MTDHDENVVRLRPDHDENRLSEPLEVAESPSDEGTSSASPVTPASPASPPARRAAPARAIVDDDEDAGEKRTAAQMALLGLVVAVAATLLALVSACYCFVRHSLILGFFSLLVAAVCAYSVYVCYSARKRVESSSDQG